MVTLASAVNKIVSECYEIYFKYHC